MRRALGKLINAMNPYSNPACEKVDDVKNRMKAVGNRRRRGVEIDNYQGEWSFMGQPCKIKRALLIPYRYQVRNNEGKKSRVWATGHLLIGYIGANG